MLQAALKTAVQKLFEISGITTGDPELEAYKIRVMLAHVRLMGARNLPTTLVESVREKCESLVAMLAPILNKGRSSSSLGEDSKVLNICSILYAYKACVQAACWCSMPPASKSLLMCIIWFTLFVT